ncbi:MULTISPECIES: hypothetical protein [Shewanella]|uniref:hypothetical protein n=1 Tax=unclassified Shewanella TaxID=196818 RepID=UPI0010C0AC81|nr:hypothetical protein [Shewanella sp. MEBiC00475]
MIITTHYPQIPLATSNVATDLARVDNQQKPPIIPPQEPAKGHQERSLNPQNERASTYIVAEKKQQQEQAKRQQQSTTQQSLESKVIASPAIRPQVIKILASQTPALQRKDIQLKTQVATAKTTPEPRQRQSLDAGESSAIYQQFGQRIGQFYQQQSVPDNQSQLKILA